MSLFGYPNQVYFILLNDVEVVRGFRAKPTTRSISFEIRESTIQPALRGRAFPTEMDASGLDITVYIVVKIEFVIRMGIGAKSPTYRDSI